MKRREAKAAVPRVYEEQGRIVVEGAAIAIKHPVKIEEDGTARCVLKDCVLFPANRKAAKGAAISIASRDRRRFIES